MYYLSTRGGLEPQQFSDILIGGLAPDGGLVVPDHYPVLDAATLAAWRSMSYPDLAYALISLFADDIPAPALRKIIDQTYTADTFGDQAITPLRPLGRDGVYILGLSNGPTLAFKDIAMQLLGNLFDYILERRAETLTILGATSGDTGSAAEYAMRGHSNVRVFMLSPYKKMSPFQTAQMFSLNEPNIFNLAVRGVFDDCQDIVKQANADSEFKRRYRIGAVNSINWGRIVAQIVYYFKGYFAATTSNTETVDIAVPSGNFGNIYAGHVARQMGLPINKLILATNENNVLDEFFRTGIYRVRQSSQVHQTSSPSMDISKASNFERFIFDLVGRDPAQVQVLWQKLICDQQFDLSQTAFFPALAEFGFCSGTSTHDDRLETIRNVYELSGDIIDTHTADGIKVGLEHRSPGVPLICQETALAAKFEQTIHEALGTGAPRPPGFEEIENRSQHFEVIDADAQVVKDFIAAQSANC